MARFALVSAAVVGFGISLVQAQSLSTQCQNALLTVAGSPEAACLNVAGLAPLLTATSNSSLITPINSWLSGACAQDPCSNQTLSDIVANITSGCSSDLSDIPSSILSSLATVIQDVFPVVREIGCLKETNNNTLCVTSLLTELQSVAGTLSIDDILNDLPLIVTGQGTDIPSYITCSDCVKQAYNILNQEASTLISSLVSPTEVASALQSQCGSSFTDGTTPSEIAEGTGSAAPTGTTTSSGTATKVPGGAILGIAITSLAAVFSGFFFLA